MKRFLPLIIFVIGILLGSFYVFSTARAAGCNPFVVAIGGTGACTFPSSNLLYGNGTGAIQSIATTSVSCSGSTSCSSFTAIGSSPITITSSGGGTPGGSDTDVQFNDSGSFGGDADFTWDKITPALTVNGNINIPNLNSLALYSGTISDGKGVFLSNLSGTSDGILQIAAIQGPGIVDFDFNGLTGEHTYTVPDESGTFCLTSTCANFSYPFTTATNFGASRDATTSPIWFEGSGGYGLFASSTEWFDQIKVGSTTPNNSGGMATSTFFGNVDVKGYIEDDTITNSLVFDGAGGTLSPYGGSSCSSHNYANAISGAGVLTCAQIALGTDVTGQLPIANGGTGAASLTGNQFLYTNPAGTIVLTAASSSLDLPNAALQNSATTVNGQTCTLGSTCTIAADTFAWPFTPTTFGAGNIAAATSSILYPSGGLVTGTSTIGTLVASSSITNQGVKSALVLNSATGLEGAYGGASACSSGNAVLSITATGGTTCGAFDTFAWPFTVNTGYVSTTTAIGLFASTTIGAGGITTGLTVNGTATTSNLINTSITSALGLFDSNHKETAYAGSSGTCTNQVPTSLSATGALGTCTSISDSFLTGQVGLAHGGTNASLSGANQLVHMNSGNTALELGGSGYALTIAGNGLLTATNASTTDLTVGTYFADNALTSTRVPFATTNGQLIDNSAFVFSNTGNTLLTVTNASTTNITASYASSTLLAIGQNANGTASTSVSTPTGNIFSTHSISLVFASSTLAYYGAYGASGTTTTVISNPLHASTIRSFYCQTDVGTVWVGFTFGAGTETTEVQCTTSGTGVAPASNNTGTGRQASKINIGHEASTPNIITVTVDVEDKN